MEKHTQSKEIVHLGYSDQIKSKEILDFFQEQARNGIWNLSMFNRQVNTRLFSLIPNSSILFLVIPQDYFKSNNFHRLLELEQQIKLLFSILNSQRSVLSQFVDSEQTSTTSICSLSILVESLNSTAVAYCFDLDASLNKITFQLDQAFHLFKQHLQEHPDDTLSSYLSKQQSTEGKAKQIYIKEGRIENFSTYGKTSNPIISKKPETQVIQQEGKLEKSRNVKSDSQLSEEIRKMVVSNQLEKAIARALLLTLSKPERESQRKQLAARLKAYRDKELAGTLSYEAARIEENEIRQSILHFVDNKYDVSTNSQQLHSQAKSSKRSYLYIIGIGVLVAILSFIAFQRGYIFPQNQVKVQNQAPSAPESFLYLASSSLNNSFLKQSQDTIHATINVAGHQTFQLNKIEITHFSIPPDYDPYSGIGLEPTMYRGGSNYPENFDNFFPTPLGTKEETGQLGVENVDLPYKIGQTQPKDLASILINPKKIRGLNLKLFVHPDNSQNALLNSPDEIEESYSSQEAIFINLHYINLENSKEGILPLIAHPPHSSVAKLLEENILVDYQPNPYTASSNDKKEVVIAANGKPMGNDVLGSLKILPFENIRLLENTNIQKSINIAAKSKTEDQNPLQLSKEEIYKVYEEIIKEKAKLREASNLIIKGDTSIIKLTLYIKDPFLDFALSQSAMSSRYFKEWLKFLKIRNDLQPNPYVAEIILNLKNYGPHYLGSPRSIPGKAFGLSFSGGTIEDIDVEEHQRKVYMLTQCNKMTMIIEEGLVESLLKQKGGRWGEAFKKIAFDLTVCDSLNTAPLKKLIQKYEDDLSEKLSPSEMDSLKKLYNF